MCKLTGPAIQEALKVGDVLIQPFSLRHLRGNSYDVTLSKWLWVYDDPVLDCAKEPTGRYIEMPQTGFELEAGRLYLGATRERAGSTKYYPGIDGRSSVGRLGWSVHVTAGFGDVGFQGYWTLELHVTGHNLVVYPGMRVAQVYFETVHGSLPASCLYKGKYKQEDEPKPIPSRLWMDFPREAA